MSWQCLPIPFLRRELSRHFDPRLLHLHRIAGSEQGVFGAEQRIDAQMDNPA
jgi:hypothetical protein